MQARQKAAVRRFRRVQTYLDANAELVPPEKIRNQRRVLDEAVELIAAFHLKQKRPKPSEGNAAYLDELDPRSLEGLDVAAGEVEAAAARAAEQEEERRVATRGISAQIKTGNVAVRVLDGLVRFHVAGMRARLAGWVEAKRVERRMG